MLVKLQNYKPMTFFIHFLNKKNTNTIQTTTQAPEWDKSTIILLYYIGPLLSCLLQKKMSYLFIYLLLHEKGEILGANHFSLWQVKPSC